MKKLTRSTKSKSESSKHAQIFSMTLYPKEIEVLKNCAKLEGLGTFQEMCREIIRIYLSELERRESNGKK